MTGNIESELLLNNMLITINIEKAKQKVCGRYSHSADQRSYFQDTQNIPQRKYSQFRKKKKKEQNRKLKGTDTEIQAKRWWSLGNPVEEREKKMQDLMGWRTMGKYRPQNQLSRGHSGSQSQG